MQPKPYFLLADDDEDDQLLFGEALGSLPTAVTCEMVKNGMEAISFLERNKTRLPACVFLDLNMPIMNGLKCLAQIKQIPDFKDLPVIIYSTSAHQQYIDESRSLGALDFFVKPSDYKGLKEYLRKTAMEMLPGH